MHRLRRFRRVPKSTVALITLGLVALVIAHFVHGSKPAFVDLPGHQRGPVDQTHWNDYLRTGLWVAAGLLFGCGVYRWNAASEEVSAEPVAHPRTFGESILDARTQVHPPFVIRPVDMSRDRAHD